VAPSDWWHRALSDAPFSRSRHLPAQGLDAQLELLQADDHALDFSEQHLRLRARYQLAALPREQQSQIYSPCSETQKLTSKQSSITRIISFRGNL